MPEAAIRSSASAKGRIKVRTSSGIEGDRSLSKSAINRPRGNSLITKSLDSSQKISMMFKKLSVASCFSRRPSPKHAKNTSAPPPTTLRPMTHPSRFASRTNAPYWKSGISAMGLRCRGWVPRVARRVRPRAQGGWALPPCSICRRQRRWRTTAGISISLIPRSPHSQGLPLYEARRFRLFLGADCRVWRWALLPSQPSS